MKISLIIAIQDDGSIFFDLLDSLKKLTKKPDEIVVVDSSIKNEFSNKVNTYLDSYQIQNNYLKISKSFQGKALNQGIKLAKNENEYIALLDTKTIPEKDWIEN